MCITTTAVIGALGLAGAGTSAFGQIYGGIYGYRSKATGYTAEAGLLGTQAEEAPIGAGIGATGSLLSGASAVGFKFGGGGAPGTVGPNQQPGNQFT